MRLTTKRMVFIAILLIVTIGASIGYYMYNKGPLNVKGSSGIPVSAEALYNAFSTDSAQALKKYGNKILSVKGIVNNVSENVENIKIITIKTGTEGAYINCSMEGPASKIKAGDEVKIKGICSGIGQGEPDLGIKGDVYLSRCFIEKI